MTEREKVIKAIEICYSEKHNCTECELFYVEDCNNKLMRDVLRLLKEQEPKLVKVDGDDVLCPLCGNKEFRGSKSMKKTNNECEETTPGKWIYVSHNPCYSPFDDSPPDFYRCSGCGYITGNRTKYCPECGQECN